MYQSMIIICTIVMSSILTGCNLQTVLSPEENGLEANAVSDGGMNTQELFLQTAEDTPLSGQLSGTSNEGVVIQYVVTSLPTQGAVLVNAQTGTFSYFPNQDFYGQDQFSYAVTVGESISNVSKVYLTIIPINDPPVANNDNLTAVTNTPAIINLFANDYDPENETLTLDNFSQPLNNFGVVSVIGHGQIQFIPASGKIGISSFTYTITDPFGQPSSATVSLFVSAPNLPPIASNDQFTINKNVTSTISPLTNDLDPQNQSLTFVTSSPIANATIAINADQTLRVTPQFNFVGAIQFSYTVANSFGLTAIGTATINVVNNNNQPMANADLAMTTPNTTVTVNVLANDSDPDLDPLQVTSFSQGNRGTVTSSGNGLLVYAPGNSFQGIDTFTYQISDLKGGAAVSAQVKIQVTTTPNLPPTAVNDQFSAAEDHPITLAVLANDNDPEGQLNLANVPAQSTQGATLQKNGQEIIYTPVNNFFGNDTFSYSVVDNIGQTGVAQVSISVTAMNDPPTAQLITLLGAPNVMLTSPVFGGNDVDLNPLTYEIVDAADHGTIQIIGDQFIYYPVADFEGIATFTYRVRDTAGLASNIQEAYINLNLGNLAQNPSDFTLLHVNNNANIPLPMGAGLALEAGVYDTLVNNFEMDQYQLTNASGDNLKIIDIALGSDNFSITGINPNEAINANQTLAFSIGPNLDKTGLHGHIEILSLIYQNLSDNVFYRLDLPFQLNKIGFSYDQQKVPVRIVHVRSSGEPATLQPIDQTRINNIMSLLDQRFQKNNIAQIEWVLAETDVIEDNALALFQVPGGLSDLDYFTQVTQTYSKPGVVNLFLIKQFSASSNLGIAWVGQEPRFSQMVEGFGDIAKFSTLIVDRDFAFPNIYNGVVIPHEMAHVTGAKHTVESGPMAAFPFNFIYQRNECAENDGGVTTGWSVYHESCQLTNPQCVANKNNIMNSLATSSTIFYNLNPEAMSQIHQCFFQISLKNLGLVP